MASLPLASEILWEKPADSFVHETHESLQAANVRLNNMKPVQHLMLYTAVKWHSAVVIRK